MSTDAILAMLHPFPEPDPRRVTTQRDEEYGEKIAAIVLNDDNTPICKAHLKILTFLEKAPKNVSLSAEKLHEYIYGELPSLDPDREETDLPTVSGIRVANICATLVALIAMVPNVLGDIHKSPRNLTRLRTSVRGILGGACWALLLSVNWRGKLWRLLGPKVANTVAGAIAIDSIMLVITALLDLSKASAAVEALSRMDGPICQCIRAVFTPRVLAEGLKEFVKDARKRLSSAKNQIAAELRKLSAGMYEFVEEVLQLVSGRMGFILVTSGGIAMVGPTLMTASGTSTLATAAMVLGPAMTIVGVGLLAHAVYTVATKPNTVEDLTALIVAEGNRKQRVLPLLTNG